MASTVYQYVSLDDYESTFDDIDSGFDDQPHDIDFDDAIRGEDPDWYDE